MEGGGALHPTRPPQAGRSFLHLVVSDEEYMAIGSSAFGEDFGSNPPLRGEEMRALLSDDDIKAAVAEVLLKDDMRKVYNKFMLSIKFGGLDIVGRRKVLKNWCYKGWDEEL